MLMRYLYLALFWGSLSFAQAIDDPLLAKDWKAQQNGLTVFIHKWI